MSFVNNKGDVCLLCNCCSTDIGCCCQSPEDWNAGHRPGGGGVCLVCCPYFTGPSEASGGGRFRAVWRTGPKLGLKLVETFVRSMRFASVLSKSRPCCF